MYYHKAVLENIVKELVTDYNGIYVDLTFGGGSHTKTLLSVLESKAKVFGFDCDEDTQTNVQYINDKRFRFIHANAIHVRQFLEYYGINKVDGIFADLGVSSHQLDTPHRGFSTRFDGPLDMRMNKNTTLTAEYIVNNYNYNHLCDIFNNYGELENFEKISSIIVSNREKHKILTTLELLSIINKEIQIKTHNKPKFFAQVFQALRIEVNNELYNLKKMLLLSEKLIKTDGKLIVLSYHSLEDRLVKYFMRSGNFTNTLNKDIYGNISRPFKMVNSKVITSNDSERLDNNRSRSVKCRIAIRTQDRIDNHQL